MWEQRLSLGKGILRVQGQQELTQMIDVIEEFGVPLKALQSLKLDKYQTQELYDNILVYRKSVRFLKDYKDRMVRYDSM